MTNLNEELLPCPFCGGQAQDDFIEDVSYIIECYVCETTTGCQDSAAEAIAAWNRRAPAAAPAPVAASDELWKLIDAYADMRAQYQFRDERVVQATADLRAALAASAPQAQAEPVAWMMKWESHTPSLTLEPTDYLPHERKNLIPLYAAPSGTGDAKDAARFRWLEKNCELSGGRKGVFMSVFIPFDIEDLGRAIDAAIASSAEEVKS